LVLAEKLLATQSSREELKKNVQRSNSVKKNKKTMEESAVTKVAIHNIQLKRKKLFAESHVLDLSPSKHLSLQVVQPRKT